MIDILFNGVGWTDIALTLNRIAVGAFFFLSGFHKLFNAERHRTFAEELKTLGVHAVGFNQWWVPSVEFAAGGARIALHSGTSSPGRKGPKIVFHAEDVAGMRENLVVRGAAEFEAQIAVLVADLPPAQRSRLSVIASQVVAADAGRRGIDIYATDSESGI